MVSKNKNLNDLGVPGVYKRTLAGGRALIRAVRGESAAKAIGDLKPDCEIFGFTKGQFSCIDLIEHCLNETGPADVFIATWSAAAGDIQRAHKFLGNGKIKSIRFLVDYSFQSRKPEFCQELIDLFGYEALRVTVTHAKYVLIINEKWNLVIRTSMNLNYNPRFENFEISDDKAMAAFHIEIIDEIWNSQERAEGFKGTPGDNKRKFRSQFREATAFDSSEMTDVRDLI